MRLPGTPGTSGALTKGGRPCTAGSSVRHHAAPSWVPLPPRPLPTAIPGSQAQLFQSQSRMGSRGLAPHSHLDPCPRQSPVLSPASPSTMRLLCPGATCFQPSSQGVLLKHIPTFPHGPQSLWFRVCLPGPITISVWALLSQIYWKPPPMQSFPRMLCALHSPLRWPQ